MGVKISILDYRKTQMAHHSMHNWCIRDAMSAYVHVYFPYVFERAVCPLFSRTWILPC